MTTEQLTAWLTTRKGASIITLTALTEPTWKAARDTGPNPHKGNVKKRVTVNGMIGWQYETSVNRQRSREGLAPDFNAAPRQWGQRITGTPFVEHKGKLYLEVKVEAVCGVEYVDSEGQAVAGVEAFIKSRDNGTDRQGVERAIVLRDFTVANIVEVAWNGERHAIKTAETYEVMDRVA